MGEIAESLGKFVSPIEKLIDCVSGAIGKAYEPRHIRKMADAEAYKVKKIGEAMRENSDIPIVCNPEGITLSTADLEEFVKRTQSRMAYQELKKQENIEATADKAYELLEGEENVSAEPVEQDWMLRFFNSVGDVSNEQMQDIWSKLLAGEIKKPGTYSLRTLETLRNMTQQEAMAFQELCTHCIIRAGTRFILQDSDYQEEYGIKFGDILQLSQCGLIILDSFLVVNFKLHAGSQFVMATDDFVSTVDSTQENTETDVSIFPLTESGIALSKVVGCHMSLEEFKAITLKLKEKLNLDKMQIHSVVSIDEEGITYNRSENLLDS